MAKKRTSATLTDAQIETLSEVLHGSGGNIYVHVGRLFGIRVGDLDDDDTFDRLRTIGEVFRCSRCSNWCGLDIESEMAGVCCDCQNEVDED